MSESGMGAESAEWLRFAGSRYPDMHISIDDLDASTAVEIAESAYKEIARLIREQETE
ncbi:MAG: hypothetical protein ACYC77_11610 [Coriobacteriia bacterium]